MSCPGYRFTPMVIQLACFSLSVAWGLASGAAYYWLRPAGELQHGVNAAVLGVLAGVATLFVLGFLGGVLLRLEAHAFACVRACLCALKRQEGEQHAFQCRAPLGVQAC